VLSFGKAERLDRFSPLGGLGFQLFHWGLILLGPRVIPDRELLGVGKGYPGERNFGRGTKGHFGRLPRGRNLVGRGGSGNFRRYTPGKEPVLHRGGRHLRKVSPGKGLGKGGGGQFEEVYPERTLV